ncbi:ceramidase [Sinomicrobium pectinilyticum]|nr:ceramidase [Sinomicrobium pectinilyticum]
MITSVIMDILALLSGFPKDSGPVYRETIEGRLPVEPFNTVSNFLFLAIIIYFVWKIRRNHRQHLFLAFILPVLFIGFIGGTLYHATRSHEIWLLLDWVPILLLCLATSVYFCIKAGKNPWSRSALLILVLLLMFGIRFMDLPRNISISVGYIAAALGIILPIALYLYFTKYLYGLWVLLAVISFSLAIWCRYLDVRSDFFPMGTHWLWHSFGALAVFFLMYYIYLDRNSPGKNDIIRIPNAPGSVPQLRGK